jgi:hypothetical protein
VELAVTLWVKAVQVELTVVNLETTAALAVLTAAVVAVRWMLQTA